jgi:hypothetical protein
LRAVLRPMIRPRTRDCYGDKQLTCNLMHATGRLIFD